ncbi:GNAT family N-acetyltransferase [Pelagicoccus enzymogenes]|uniref:GNAT family N-acetyltransferase n=1 Tax=Pelagicoccus enzymogenes TaxID=2773457 RepID=UPI00280F8FA2|nr:GNAT family N-acetyltransferase [Pelagicoccus enzymogenes]MDQ8199924.1 GNAT family N-acetyltransferase [Pelagicoccus enzymogenes]
MYPEKGYENCYVCSLRSQYVDYAAYELEERDLGTLAFPLNGVIFLLAGLLRLAGSERVVFVNNWLLSTNLYPAGLESQVESIRDRLRGDEPQRAIVFRSLNETCNGALIASLKQSGFVALASRVIYLLDTPSGAQRDRSNFRRDCELLQKSGLEVARGEQFEGADWERAEELYRKLYLEKYTALNPHFTAAFFAAASSCGFLKFVGLRNGGHLVGVVGYHRCEGWITAPVLGYDTEASPQLGLYRQLTALLTLEGERLGCRIHRSSGAEAFKRTRGAVREMEYSYVYVDHLPFWRRWAWRLFGRLLGRAAAISFRRLKL